MAKLTFILGIALLLCACSPKNPNGVHTNSAHGATSSSLDSTLQLPQLALPVMGRYWDPKAGYEAQIPLGWQRVVLDESGDNSFTVSFESPPSSESDQFADYLLIEVVPGQAVPGFEQDPDDRTAMVVDGENVFRERHILNQHPVADTLIDLVAWQISLIRPGYSVFMYAVGESREDSRLERILIEFAHSFSLQRAPFQLS